MARKPRNCPGGYVYHVLNRSAGRIALFRDQTDYDAFERVMQETYQRVPLRILSWCLMRNHWHFVVWPRSDDEVTAFFRWLTHTHAMRWRVAHRSVGWGHLYQGRFKSFPIEPGHHVLSVCRYVERNALTAGVVKRAQDWRWGSLWVRQHGSADGKASELRQMLTPGAVKPWPRLGEWTQLVNAVQTKKELRLLDLSVERSRPFGGEPWVGQTVKRLGLEHTIRAEGRPPKVSNADSA